MVTCVRKFGVIHRDVNTFYKVLYIVEDKDGILTFHCTSPGGHGQLYKIREDDKDFKGVVALDD